MIWFVCASDCFLYYDQNKTGLSFRGGGGGFPPATMNVVPGYFHRKIEEKQNQENPLTV